MRFFARLVIIHAAICFFLSQQIRAEVALSEGAFENKRVLIIGIDGLRSDALQRSTTSNIDRLISAGVVTYEAIAGGEVGTDTEQPTISGPGWSTILTGVFANKHLVRNNQFTESSFQDYPHFFERLKESHTDAWLGSIVEWGGIDRGIVAPSADFIDLRSVPDTDEGVAIEAAELLRTQNPDVLFTHFIGPDGYGHSTGYDPDHPSYQYAINITDRRVGIVMDALNARPGVKDGSEDWLTIVISDHGGMDIYHGGQSIHEKHVPFIVSGKNVPQGLQLSPGPYQTAVVPTVLRHLGVAINPAWGWEGKPFGFAPFATANFTHSHRPGTGTCVLSWRAPVGMNVQGFRLYRNGGLVVELPPNSVEYIDQWEGLDSSDIDVYYELETFLAAPEVLPFLGTHLERASLPLSDQLVAYYPFESSYQDDSGSDNSNSGEVGGGTPAFVAGRLGSGLFLDGVDDFLTLGEGADFQFGSDADFTVALWYQVQSGQAGFPTIIGNKNWRAYENPGFVLLGNRGTGDDISLQAGDGILRLDPPTLDIGFNRWYFLSATFDRDGDMTLFIMNQSDERRQAISMAEMGNFDSGLPLNLGQDGTGNHPRFTKMTADEVMIWRRALSPIELRHIFEANKAGYTLGQMIGVTDVDADGIGDRWEIEEFGNLDANPEDDGDGDELFNLVEWVIGTDPQNTSSSALTYEFVEPEMVKITYNLRTNQGDLKMRLESSSELINWSPVSDGDIRMSDRNENSNFEQRTFTTSLSSTDSVPLFLRLIDAN